MSHRPWISAPGTPSIKLHHLGQGVYAAVVDVTRPLAKEWLGEGDVWRKKRDPGVQKVISHLEANAWVLDGNTVKFDKHGKLQDGQHRLTAVVITGIILKTLIVMGEIEQHPNLDTGIPRNLADFLRHMKKHLASLLAAILRMHVVWERTHGDFTNFAYVKTKPPITNEICLAILATNPDLEEAAKFGQGQAGALRSLLSPTVISHLWFVFTRESPQELVHAFFNGVADPSKLAQDDPRAALRRFLEKRYQQGRLAGNVSKDVPTYHAITIKAWNFFLTGQPVQNLRWSRFAKKPEKFPEVLVWDEFTGISLEDL